MKSGIVAVVALAISLFAVLGGVALADHDEGHPALELRVEALEAHRINQDLAIAAIEVEFASLPALFPTLAAIGLRVVSHEQSIDSILPSIGGIHEDIAALETADATFFSEFVTLEFVTDQRLLMLEAFHP